MKKAMLLFSLLCLTIHGVQAAVYDITDYGAVPGSYSTPAIQQAIDACNENGGGVVYVPAGTFITGTLVLKSNVNLHLEQGAILQASLNLDHYLSTFRKHGILFCEDAENVSVTGQGTIDARGIEFYDPTQNHTYDEFDKSVVRQGENYMPQGEFYTDGPIKRKPKPGMTITFYYCCHVKLEDITIKDTPEWATRFAYCDDVRVSGLSIMNNLMIPNSDGVHCTASRNVRISDCDIRAGDDAIIVTGFTTDEETPGYDMSIPQARPFGNKSEYSENISVTNCHLQSRSSGIRIGYGQHPIRRCTFSNIQIYGSNRGIGIFAHDASNIEELIFSNIIIRTRLHNGQWWGNGEPIHISAISRFEGEKAGQVKNVMFDHIIATSEHGILFYGLEASRLSNISLHHVQLRIVKGVETLAYGGNFDLRPATPIKMQLFEHDIPGIYAQHVDGLKINDFQLTWGPNLPAFFTHALECHQVTGLRMRDVDWTANPNCPDCKPLLLKDTLVIK